MREYKKQDCTQLVGRSVLLVLKKVSENLDTCVGKDKETQMLLLKVILPLNKPSPYRRGEEIENSTKEQLKITKIDEEFKIINKIMPFKQEELRNNTKEIKELKEDMKEKEEK